MKKSIILISAGALNLLHASFHLIQFIQSMLLVVYSSEDNHHHDESWIDTILHSPYFAFLWALIGILTLAIGIRDYRHHNRCKKT